MDALKRKMEIAAVAFFCTVTALIAAYSCATTAAANLAQQTAAAPVTEYVTLAYMEVQPEAEQEPELLYDVPMSDELQRYVREQAERQGVPFEIALAVIERESSYIFNKAFNLAVGIRCFKKNDLINIRNPVFIAFTARNTNHIFVFINIYADCRKISFCIAHIYTSVKISDDIILISMVVRPVAELEKNRQRLILQYGVSCVPFLFDNDSKTEPTEFQIYFRQSEREYRYYIAVLDGSIISESLYWRNIGGKRTGTVFEREKEKIKLGTSISKSGINKMVNPRMPYLSFLAINYNLDVITEVMTWFES